MMTEKGFAQLPSKFPTGHADKTDESKALEWRGLFCTGDLHAHFFSPHLPELSNAAAGGKSSSVFLEANQVEGRHEEEWGALRPTSDSSFLPPETFTETTSPPTPGTTTATTTTRNQPSTGISPCLGNLHILLFCAGLAAVRCHLELYHGSSMQIHGINSTAPP